jgi:hypothetical protein
VLQKNRYFAFLNYHVVKKISIVIGCVLTTLTVFGQKEKKQPDEKLISIKEEWNEGSILTTEGKELKGLLWYNDNNGILTFKDGTDTRVFLARSVAGFEFFDETTQKQRVYYVLDYTDPYRPGGKRAYFFELLHDFKTFAVVAKSDPVEVEVKHGSNTYMSPGTYAFDHKYSEVSQTETLYFLNTNGDIRPYLKLIKKEYIGRYFWDERKEKNKLVDEGLLAEYVSESVYSNLQAYAKLNELKFKNKEDFLKILDYYAQNWANKQ